MNSLFQENKSEQDLSTKAIRGGAVSVLARGSTAALQLLTTLALARLLAPEDFGLVAIILALSGFAPGLIDMGLSDVTLQRPRITRAQVSLLFWISVGLSLFAAALLAFTGPLIAAIYRQPALSGIAAAMAMSFVFSGLAVQHIALLRRAMRFAAVARIDVIAYLISAAVAIVVALLGFGFWALVARQVVASGCTAVGAWITCSWRPGLPHYDDESKSMIKFGMHVTGYSMTSFISRGVDRAALGLVYAPQLVGYYQNAVQLYNNAISALAVPLHNVGVAALSKLQRDPAAVRKKYTAALSNLTFFSMPAFATLALVGRDLVPWLLGEKWSPAGVLLAILACRGIVHTIETSQGWLHLAMGHPGRWMRWGFLTALMQVLGVGVALPFGPQGVAVAYVVVGWVLAVPSVLYAGRPVGIGIGMIARAVGRQFIAASIGLLVGAIVLHFIPEGSARIVRILLSATTCLGVYLMAAVGIFRMKDPLRLGFSTLKKFVPQQS